MASTLHPTPPYVIPHTSSAPWWDTFVKQHAMIGSILSLPQLESQATEILHYGVMLPGLLQTEEYMTEVFLLSGHNIHSSRADIIFRLNRQWHFFENRTRRYRVVINEDTLRRPLLGPAAMRRQHLHLIELAESGIIELRIYPSSARIVRISLSPPKSITLYTLPEGKQQMSIEQYTPIETIVSEEIIIREFHLRMNELMDVSLSTKESIQFLKQLIAL